MEIPDIEASRDPAPHTIWRKLVDTFAGAVLPAICFVLGEELRPDWQDGSPSTYVLLFLGETVTVAFLPVLVLAVVAFLLAVWWPRAAKHGVVQFLTLSGLLLAFPYGLATSVYWFGDQHGWTGGILLALPAGALVILLPGWCIRLVKLGWRRVHFLGALAAVMVIVGSVPIGLPLISSHLYGESMQSEHLFGATMIVWILFVLSAAPFWTFAVFVRRVVEWWRSQGGIGFLSQDAQWGLSLGWMAAWLITWRTAVAQVLAEYANLPMEPPTCFLATVAAEGDAGFVGSEPTSVAGRTFPVTRQLRRFKAFELILRRFLPDVHRSLRRVYDSLGPRLAERLSRPWLADATWLLLKPIEMVAAMWMWLAGTDARRHVERIWPAR